ncbi:MAG: hypothetical protein OEQ47_15995 [Acidimicrobiia bacterium]|nr:hypothetical protein [Acidimicrobiia bacterium]
MHSPISSTAVRRASERGAAFTEYMLLVSLVAIVIMVTLTVVGRDVGDFFDDAADCMEAPASDCTQDTVPFDGSDGRNIRLP